MSSSTNSVAPFLGGTAKDALEAIGITQFPDATSWYQVIGGIIVQGGLVEVGSSATLVVNLPAPYEKQFLGVWTQVITAAANGAYAVTGGLTSFQIVNGVGIRSYYWLSLGV